MTVHEGGPVFLAERLDHFYAGDGVVLAGGIAIVLQTEIDRTCLHLQASRAHG